MTKRILICVCLCFMFLVGSVKAADDKSTMTPRKLINMLEIFLETERGINKLNEKYIKELEQENESLKERLKRCEK